ncbi:hypothetical protein Slu03_06350 [Sediminihabitans luteus]|nr:hypothetical protein Slu03_06350 [Sediminihabitans luteus]
MPAPLARTSALVAAVAERLLGSVETVVHELNAEVGARVPALAADRAIADDTAASNRRTVLHFLHSVAAHPDRPVAAQPLPEIQQKVTNLVRRSVDVDVVIQAYRYGQQAIWDRWMDATGAVVEDPAEVAAVLRQGSDLLFGHVNDLLALEVAEIQRQRDEIAAHGTNRRAETIRLLLDAAPVDPAAVSARFGYDARGRHTCLVLWDGRTDDAALESAASAIAARLGCRWVGLRAGAGQLWAWLAGDVARDALATAWSSLDAPPHVLVGPTLRGVEGFRTSHHVAVDVQRFAMQDAEHGALTWCDELGPVALAGADTARARAFVAEALGGLAADDATLDDLRRTLLVYFEEGESAPRAAARLFTHRNTVLQRVARAVTLVGAPLAQRRLRVFLALELAHRLGRDVLTPTS